MTWRALAPGPPARLARETGARGRQHQKNLLHVLTVLRKRTLKSPESVECADRPLPVKGLLAEAPESSTPPAALRCDKPSRPLVLSPAMEDSHELHLTYVTERIIAVSFPASCSEESYLHSLQEVTRMLKSKHGDNYLVLNLSEKRYDLTKLNPKIMDVGWPELHAPPLDKMCTICKAQESWLNSDPQHVVVIHCRPEEFTTCPHSFKKKDFKKPRVCGACRQTIAGQGIACRGLYSWKKRTPL